MWHPDMPAEYQNEIVCGDARVLSERIPDASVDLIFTDPVYDRIEDYAWLAETAARVLKPDSACLVWCGIRDLFAVQSAMLPFLDYGWLIVWYQANSRSFIRSILGHHHYAPLLWMMKGDSRPRTKQRDHISTSWNMDDYNHGWSKHPHVIGQYTDAFTQPNAVIFDPFTGGGTVPAVCKMLNRNYIAFEIDAPTAERARTRVAQMQAMHPVLLGVQEPMELAI